MNCYGGSIVRVDLSSGLVSREATDPDEARAYLGGRGLNIKRLWDEVPAHTEGTANENKVVFGVGPLVGSLFPGGSRYNVSGMSPQTGILGDSNAGGFFGPELKFAGVDQLIIEGRSERPVYVYVADGLVEVRDASGIWGLDVTEATEAFRAALGDRDVQAAVIGPAAENGVRFSGVFSNLVRAAARTGMGAVLASKNVKGIAVRGTGIIPVADMARFQHLIDLVDKRIYAHDEYEIRVRLGTTKLVAAMNGLGGIVTRHFQSGVFEHADEVSGEAIEARYKVKSKACFSCTIPCSRFLVVEDPRFPGLKLEGPEYEPLAGFTSRIGNGDLAFGLRCIDLANRMGLDAITLSEVISWTMECRQSGILSAADTDGLDLSWGDQEGVLQLIDKIVHREGFGDVLADGVRVAAERVGRGSEDIAMHSKGLEVFQADPRSIKAYALGNAVSSRGADHLRSEPWFEFSGDAEEGIRRYGAAESAFRLEYKGKGRVVKHFEEMAAVCDSLGVCKNTYNNMEVLSWDETAELLNAGTGWDMSGEEIQRAGERIVNLERLLIAREGIGRKDDTLPRRFLEEPLGPPGSPSAGEVVRLEGMLDEYYEARGWDLATGLPTREKLAELGLRT
jgi:aldehyde:ferredoxin oxidoreductase